MEEGIATPILLGRRDEIERLMEELEFDEEILIIDPKEDNSSVQKNRYAEIYWKQQKRKGITLLASQKLMREKKLFCGYDG